MFYFDDHPHRLLRYSQAMCAELGQPGDVEVLLRLKPAAGRMLTTLSFTFTLIITPTATLILPPPSL
jgi:hypothetical protein